MERSGEMNARSASSGPPAWVQRLAKITGFFVFVGPLVGTLVWLAGAVIDGLIFYDRPVPRLGPVETILALPYLIFLAIPYGYLLGALPAALAGLILSATQLRCGRLRWYFVVLVGIAVGVADIFIGKQLVNLLSARSVLQSRPNWEGFVFPVVTCMVATLVCWRFVRNWYTEIVPSGQPHS